MKKCKTRALEFFKHARIVIGAKFNRHVCSSHSLKSFKAYRRQKNAYIFLNKVANIIVSDTYASIGLKQSHG